MVAPVWISTKNRNVMYYRYLPGSGAGGRLAALPWHERHHGPAGGVDRAGVAIRRPRYCAPALYSFEPCALTEGAELRFCPVG